MEKTEKEVRTIIRSALHEIRPQARSQSELNLVSQICDEQGVNVVHSQWVQNIWFEELDIFFN